MHDLVRRGEIDEQITRQLSRELGRIRREVEEAMFSVGVEANAVSQMDPQRWQALTSSLEGFFRMKLEEVYIEAAHSFQETLAYNMEPDDLRAAAQAWAEDRARLLVTQMTRTTERRLRRTVAEFVENQWTNAQLRQALVSIFGPTRASVAAVTEVTRAASEARQRVANELRNQGVEMRARWRTVNDERVCPICNPRDGMLQGTNWFDLPPAHPKCRCFVNYEPVLEDESP